MRIHILLTDGPYVGELFSMFSSKPKPQIRLTSLQEVRNRPHSKVFAEVYVLTASDPLPQLGLTHAVASYVHSGPVETAPELVDYVFDGKEQDE